MFNPFGGRASTQGGAEVLTGHNGNGADPTGMTIPIAEDTHLGGLYNHDVSERRCAQLDELINSFDIRALFPDGDPEYHRLLVGVASLCAPLLIPRANTSKTVDKIIGPHMRSLQPEDADLRLEEISGNLDVLANGECFMRNLSKLITVTEGQDKYTADSRYELIRAVANHHARSATTEDRGVVWALAYEEAHITGDTPGFATEINQELRDGRLDSCLAQDLVTSALNSEPRTKKERRQAQGIAQAVEFAKQMSGKDEVDDALIVAMTSPQALESWPRDAKQVLTEKRSEMAESVDSSLRMCTKELRDRGFIFPNPDKQSLEAGMAKYFKKVERREVATLGVTEVLKRKRMTKDPNPSEMPQSQRTLPEKPRRKILPNKILARDKDGEHVKLSAEGMIEMAKEAFSVDKTLEQDIESIYKYLRKINLKSPGGSGMKRIERHKKGADGKPFYEFKPGEAVGLPTTTKLTRRLRVIFSLENNRFIIHGVVNRDKLDSSLKIIDRKINAPKGNQLKA